MKKNNLFSLLIKNAFRILSKSKLLIFELIILLIIGVTTIMTTIMSSFLMFKSKEHIIKSGNLADATVQIPTQILNNINNSNSSLDINTGVTNADLELQEYLKTLNINYSFSKNLSISDITTNNNFILSSINQENSFNINPDGTSNVINRLVMNSGNNIPNVEYDKSDELFNINQLWIFNSSFDVLNNYFDNWLPRLPDIWTYEKYMEIKPWTLVDALLKSVWILSSNSSKPIIEILQKIAIPPRDKNDFYHNYFLFNNRKLPTTLEEMANKNSNSYFLQLSEIFSISHVNYTGWGYSITCRQTMPLIGSTGTIPFQIELIDKTSYFSILSTNFINSNRNKIQELHVETIKDVMALPYKQNNINGDYKTYPVYDQDLQQKVNQIDFVTWFNNLDSKYKISINSTDYLVIGSGDAPNLLYPSPNANQIFIDSKTTGVAFTNDLGFMRALHGTSYNPYLYYALKFPSNINIFDKNKLLTELKQWTLNKYGEVTAYALNDSKQPNQDIYIWANFLNKIQGTVILIGAIIGAIVTILGLFFIGLLLRSIVKLNKATFGIGLANGVSKSKLAFSFFPFALVPALIVGLIAFFLSYFLVNPTIGIISNYWTLSIASSPLLWWIWLSITLATFVLLYVTIIIIIFITLRQNTQTILNSTNVLKVNKFVIYTKKITSQLTPMWSFRVRFATSNFSRLFTLLFIVITSITLASSMTSLIDVFNTSLANNLKNKKYLAGYDLYSPTINSGYYSAMPYTQIGTSQQGSFNGYDTATNNYNSPDNMNSGFYTGPLFEDAFKYPYQNNLWFTSLFLPTADVADDINNNIQFVKNRLFNKLLLDIEVNVLGSIVNPWDFAKQIIPESISHLAVQNEQLLAETSYNFYLWLQTQNDSQAVFQMDELIGTEFEEFNNKVISYSDFLPNVTKQPFTLDGSNITDDYNTATNKRNWIFVKVKDELTDKEKWSLNKDFAIKPAPTYSVKAPTVKLFSQLLTNVENKLYRMWYSYIYEKNPNRLQKDQIVPDYNYKLMSQVVPFEHPTKTRLGDETYTYIESLLLSVNNKARNNINIKINGIKDDSQLVKLLDKNDIDLKQKLIDYEVKEIDGLKTYPLVINKVVQLEQKLKVGDILTNKAINVFDRFNLKNIYENSSNGNETNNEYLYNFNFEIVGITNTNYETQYYTLQKYANEILGFGNFDNVEYTNWKSTLEPGKGYVPFNGVYSQDPELSYLKKFGGFYTPSGLSTIIGELSDDVGTGENQTITWGNLVQLFYINSDKLTQLTNLNKVVDRENNNAIKTVQLTPEQELSWKNSGNGTEWDLNQVGDSMRKIINLFGDKNLINVQLVNIDIPSATTVIGNLFDDSIMSVEGIIVSSIIPTLLIIITLISIILVIESKRLVALLKVLGYNNFKTSFSLATVYYMVLILGTILAIPITYLVKYILTTAIFSSFKIILDMTIYWWVFAGCFIGIGLIFSLALLYIYIQIKKMNTAEEISTR